MKVPLHCDAICAFTLHWVGPDAAEVTCYVQKATGDRYSALQSPVLPQPLEGRPGPVGRLWWAPASLPAGTLASAYCTSGRL